MAPEIAYAAQEATAGRWEVQLAQSAVSQLNGHVPPQLKPDVVKALVGRLREEKASRSITGGAWEDHARESVQRLLAEILENAKKKAEITAFFRENNGKALAYAESILGNLAAAQDAVSQTYIEVLEGKASIAHFFRALKCNVRDMKRRLTREAERFEPTEKVFDPHHLPGEDGMSGGTSDEFSIEPASTHPEDQDPLEQLIRAEERKDQDQLIGEALNKARTERSLWWIRQKKWGRELGIGRKAAPGLSTK